MSKIYFIFLLTASVLMSGCAVQKNQPTKGEESSTTNQAGLLQVCPEEKIVNKMPQIGKSSGGEYYILDGKRREIAEFDADWVAKNCKVSAQEVW